MYGGTKADLPDKYVGDEAVPSFNSRKVQDVQLYVKLLKEGLRGSMQVHATSTHRGSSLYEHGVP